MAATRAAADLAEPPCGPASTLTAESKALSRLLGDQARDLMRGFGRQSWRGRIAPGAARALFDWSRLNSVLAGHRFDASRLYLSGAGRTAVTDSVGRVAPQKLLAALRDGATLILNAAHEASPPLQALCDGLAGDFTCFSQANLYACWRSSPGFGVHWDDHDVLVVQVEGRKRWAFYGLVREAPVLGDDPPDHRPPSEPQVVFDLEPGDVLYLPRGCWHAAAGVDEPSLHLTIGLTRRNGSDFLHWLADRMLSQPAARRDLSFERGDDVVADQLRSLLDAVCAGRADELAAAYRRHVEAAVPVSPGLCLPMIGGPESGLGDDDTLTLASGAARVEPATSPGACILAWRGTRFTVSDALEGPLQRLVVGERVSFADLCAGASRERALAFVREMIGRGVLVRTAADLEALR